MDAAEPTIVELMTGLTRCIDASGKVVDASLREKLLAAHSGAGVAEGDEPAIALGKPATEADLAALDALFQSRFGRAVPPDLRGFLALHDGLSLLWLAPGTTEIEPLAPEFFSDGAILSVINVIDRIEAMSSEETSPDGDVSIQGPKLVPVYEIGEVGFHGLDLRDPDRVPPMVDVDGELAFEPDAEHPLIATSFTRWLARFIEVGLSPFEMARQD